jgi:hypothetical protein
MNAMSVLPGMMTLATRIVLGIATSEEFRIADFWCHTATSLVEQSFALLHQ